MSKKNLWQAEINELSNSYKQLSGVFQDLEKELKKLINAEDEVVLLLYSRRSLELIVNDICEKEAIKLSKTIPLKGIIDKLNKEDKVPSHIISSMLNLNSISTYGAHPKEFDPRQVQTTLINLITILDWYISHRLKNPIAAEKIDKFKDLTNKNIGFLKKISQTGIIQFMLIYTAAVFLIFELIELISGPLIVSGNTSALILAITVGGYVIIFFLFWLTKSNRIEQNRAQGRQTKPSIKKAISSITSLVIIGGVATVFLFSGSKSVTFEERDWIIISDFENLTADSLFDHSLNVAFRLSLSQSRYLNVISRKRMLETLRRMKRKDNTVDEETAMEIAVREGINICIVPSISKVGDQFILTAKIIDVSKGKLLKSEVLFVEGENEILQNLDHLCTKVRRILGESRYQISGQNKPLSKVTTSDLSALKEYSIAIDYHLKLNFREAYFHYEKAVNIDTGFTAAKASLGNILFEKFDREKGRIWMEKAISSIDNLTEKEKYGILASYSYNVENDVDKAIENTKFLTALYPDDPGPHNNLGWYYQNKQQYKKAIEEYKSALKINPDLMITQGGLIWIYLDVLGEIDSALVWSENMIKKDPENPWGFYYLGSCHVCKGELQEAAKDYLKAKELAPAFSTNLYRLAHVYRLTEEYQKAVDVLKEILKINQEEVVAYYNIGINYELAGNKILSKENFLKFKEFAEGWKKNYAQNPNSYIHLGLVNTHLGEKQAGLEIGKKAIELDSTIHFRYAELLAAQDKKDEAIPELQKAIENGDRNLTWILLNPDIRLLHKEESFRTLIKKYFPLVKI